MKLSNIYIHVPFCASKCGYCVFYSVPEPEPELIRRYLDHLEKSLAENRHEPAPETIYIGGGTPSLLSPGELERLFALLRKYIKPSPATEISIECNPETITREKAAIIAAFANRVSLGVQSFSAAKRNILGRRANGKNISDALEFFSSAGIKNFNLDLIYGIPGQTENDWEHELRQAIASGAKHLSCYALTIEEGAAIARRRLPPVNDGSAANMWQKTGEICAQAGIRRYEVSNYAANGFECRHNQNVWHGRNYLGLGPAACSFDGQKRWSEPVSLQLWLQNEPPEIDEIAADYRLREIFIMGLRTTAGWTVASWRKTDVPREYYRDWTELFPPEKIEMLETDNLLTITPEAIRPTEKGLLFWDTIAEALLF